MEFLTKTGWGINFWDFWGGGTLTPLLPKVDAPKASRPRPPPKSQKLMPQPVFVKNSIANFGASIFFVEKKLMPQTSLPVGESTFLGEFFKRFFDVVSYHATGESTFGSKGVRVPPPKNPKS